MRLTTDPLSSRSFPLWFGVLAPPMVWGAHLVLGDLIFELGCSPGVKGHTLAGLSLETWGLIQTTVAAVIIVAAGLLAAAAWRRIVATSNGTAWNRAHALALAGIAADARVEDRAAGQRDDGPDPGGGEARPGHLVVGQGVLTPVLRGVGHGDRRPVEQADAAALPQPPPVDPLV